MTAMCTGFHSWLQLEVGDTSHPAVQTDTKFCYMRLSMLVNMEPH